MDNVDRRVVCTSGLPGRVARNPLDRSGDRQRRHDTANGATNGGRGSGNDHGNGHRHETIVARVGGATLARRLADTREDAVGNVSGNDVRPGDGN